MIKAIVSSTILFMAFCSFGKIKLDKYSESKDIVYEILNRTITDYLLSEVFSYNSKSFIMSDVSGNFPVDSMCQGTILVFNSSDAPFQMNDSVFITSEDLNQLLTDKKLFGIKFNHKLISPEKFEALVCSNNKAVRLDKRNTKHIKQKIKTLVNRFTKKNPISREKYDLEMNRICAMKELYITANCPVFNNDSTLSMVYLKTSEEAFDAVYFWKKTLPDNWMIIDKRYCNIVTI